MPDSTARPHDTKAQSANAKGWLPIAAATAVAAPALVLRGLEVTGIAELGLASGLESAIFGLTILAAATLLIWASEVAERLISATLALAVLAIIAVLPEYAVDLFFAWTAPDNPENAQLALANMTGANRLLIGFAWPLVFLVFWLRQKKGTRKRTLRIGEDSSTGIVFLGIATLYSFSIPLRGNLSLIDSGVLISLFALYLIISSRSPPREEGELIGPSVVIAALPLRTRWAAIIGIFVFAAATVFAAAEPFAEGLVDTGKSAGIDEFLLIQWVAPLASEAPEFLLAAMLALRGRAMAGMTLLISSKVNQWTLLVGSLPLAFAISGGSFSPLNIESRQVEEVFLTAAQSIFAVAVLTNLRFSAREAILIFVLFTAQLVIPIETVRIGFGAGYMVLAIGWFVAQRGSIFGRLRETKEQAFGTPAPVPPHGANPNGD